MDANRSRFQNPFRLPRAHVTMLAQLCVIMTVKQADGQIGKQVGKDDGQGKHMSTGAKQKQRLKEGRGFYSTVSQLEILLSEISSPKM